MGIKTNVTTVRVFVDPLNISGDMLIMAGNAVQTFNKETQEYVPDRNLVPLILFPSVVTADPSDVGGEMNGSQPLTGVEWYDGVPLADGSNRISTGTDYEIGDGTVEGFPKYALKIKKNIDPNAPAVVTGIALFTDRRTNTEMRVELSKELYTALYDPQNYSVRLDAPSSLTIDPLKETANDDGEWRHTVTAQLLSGTEDVSDDHAAYWWEVYENNVWRTVNDEDIATWIDAKDAQGNFTKTLSFDARMLNGTMAFRARAAYYNGTRPESPVTDHLQATMAVKLEMDRTVKADVRMTKGMRPDAKMKEAVGYECVLSNSRETIGTDKDSLFLIEWWAKSAKIGSAEMKLGEGRTMEFVPASCGFDPSYEISVYATVKLYAGHSLVTNGGTAVTNGGIYMTYPTYE